jgi:thioredoxin 1
MSKIKLYDFAASWCGPCKQLSPIIDSLKKEFEGNENVEIIKIDIDAEPELTAQYNIRSVPTLIYLKDDEVVHRSAGATTKQNILNKINELV